METTVREADVVVVGAGLAGLAAARRLAAAGCTVVVLEARGRVGGRVESREIGDGKVVDLGAQFLGPGQERVSRLAAELGLETFRTYDEGRSAVIIGGRRYEWRPGGWPRIGLAVLVDFGQAMKRLDRMARSVPLDAPWRARNAAGWDSQTLETWLRRNLLTRDGRAQMRLLFTTLFASEPETVSLLHALFFVRAAGSLEALIRTDEGAQQRRFAGGAQQLPLRMAGALPDAVEPNAPVRRIAVANGRVTAESERLSVVASRAIVTVPPSLADRIAYEPALPADRDLLTQRMPHGSVIKAMAVYDEPFWRADGLSGHASDTTLAVSSTFDSSPPDGSPGVLLGFIEGEAARRAGRLTEEEQRREVAECLGAYFGPRAARPERVILRDWSAEEWTRGCYGAHMPPGAWTQYGHALRRPVGPIHWAGTETATAWVGYMEGALESGERAAAEVLEALSR